MLSFAVNLSKLLSEKGLTQKELASLIGTTEATISRYINGERSPNAELVAKMAKVLNTTSDFLLGNTNDPTSIDRLTRMVEEAKKESATNKYTVSDQHAKHLSGESNAPPYRLNEEQRPVIHDKNKVNDKKDIYEILKKDDFKRNTCEMLLQLPDSDIEKVETFIRYLLSL